MERRAFLAGAVACSARRSPARRSSRRRAPDRVSRSTLTLPPRFPWNISPGLRDLGWIEGQNIAIEPRWSEGREDRFTALAAELVRRKVDIIVASSTPAALAAKRATSTIPIVVTYIADPVGTGLVASLARPGGNITGLTTHARVAGNNLELLGGIAASAEWPLSGTTRISDATMR